jgi:hypothetical protein
LATACLEDSKDGHRQRHGGRLASFADQVQHAVSAQRLL